MVVVVEPLVSVVMPLYNKERWVARAIDSVRAQSLDRWELLVVDDGSTDGSATRVPTDDPRIRMIRQANAGPSAARNRAIALARAPLVDFLDADDAFEPHKLATEAARMAEADGWLVSAGTRHLGERVQPLPILETARQRGAPSGGPRIVDDAMTGLALQGVPADGICVTRELLARVGGFDEALRTFEVTDLVVRLALAAPRVLVLPEPLYQVHDVPGSAFKDLEARSRGARGLGEVMLRLAKLHPERRELLERRAERSFLASARLLAQDGQRMGAWQALFDDYPLPRGRRWVRTLVATQLTSAGNATRELPRRLPTGAQLRRLGQRAAGAVLPGTPPTFLVPGAQKAGTVALFRYLEQHPQVVAARTKEIGFFSRESTYARGVGWYRRQFPRTRAGVVTFEATPEYLYYPPCAERIARYDPRMRFVVLLRDPARRAWSAWNMFRSLAERHPERLRASLRDADPARRASLLACLEQGDFERAVREDADRLDDQGAPLEPSFVRRGLYARQLSHLLEYFPREQLLVRFSEDLRSDPRSVLSDVIRFLGLEAFDWSRASLPPLHQGAYPEGALDPELEGWLRAIYRPHDRELESLLGREVPW